MQLEIGLNGILYKNGINIKNNIASKNTFEYNLDRQNYFNSHLGRYYDISFEDFRKTFYQNHHLTTTQIIIAISLKNYY